MRIARVRHGADTFYGVVEGADPERSTVTPIVGTPFDSIERTGSSLPLSEVQLLAPLEPSKVVGMGLNYPTATVTRGPEIEPAFFLKPPSAVIAPGDPVRLPGKVGGAMHEIELAIVIGKQCRDVPAGRYQDVVFGYTCANDITGLGLPEAAGGQWVQSKGFDTFCPLGPWIETELDPSDLTVTMAVNGEQIFSRSTADMITKVPNCVELVSSVMTLLPGDVILTSAPGLGEIKAGDEMVATIEGIGTLANPVA